MAKRLVLAGKNRYNKEGNKGKRSWAQDRDNEKRKRLKEIDYGHQRDTKI